MLHKVLGIMTGTSCDGIDAALMITDGENHIHRIQYIEQPFTTEFAQKLKNAGHKAHTDGCVDLNSDSITKLQQEYTQTIIDFVLHYFDTTDIELIGFHGQTILHQPTKGITIQLGLPQLLANATKTNVVFNFRQNDIQNGGQGAPLVPLYHVACVQDLPQPVTFVNIGGVSNVTYCGDPIMGFDIGTGNCISDDFTQEFFNKPFDKHGDIAASGNIHIENGTFCGFFATTTKII
jgi:anhydro-N-acetylmuramic acid kinase